MADIAKYNLLVNIESRVADAQRDIKSVEKGLGNVEKSVTRTNKGFSSFAKNAIRGFKAFIALKAFQAIASGIKVLGKAAGELESLEQSFATLTGSAAKAREVLDDLREFSNETPFQNDSINNAARSLLSYGVAADDAVQAVKNVGELAAATGAPIEALAEAYGKANARFKVTNETLELFANNGVDILGLFAQRLGISTQEVIKLASQGKITFNELKEVIAEATGEGGRFAGALQRQSQTINGLVSTIQGKFAEAVKVLGSRFGPIFKFILSGVNDLVDAISGWVNSLDEELGIKAVATFKATGAVIDVFFNNVRIGFESLSLVTRTAVGSILARIQNLANPALGQTIVENLYKAQERGLASLENQIEDYGLTFDAIYNLSLQKARENKKAQDEFKLSINSVTGAIDGQGEAFKRAATQGAAFIQSIEDLRELNAEATRLLGEGIIEAFDLESGIEAETKAAEEKLQAFLDNAAALGQENADRTSRFGSRGDGFFGTFFGTREEQEQQIETLLNGAKNATTLLLGEQVRRRDQEVQIQRDKIAFLSSLSEGATDEQLRVEQERLATLQREREKAARQQQQIAAIEVAAANAVAIAEGIKAVTKGFGENLLTGIATSISLAATIATTIAGLSNAFGSIPAFYEGIENTGRGNLDSKGGFLSILHPNERVLTANQNKSLQGIPNESIPALVKLGQAAMLAPSDNKIAANESQDMKELKEEMRNVRSAISSLKISMNVDGDGVYGILEGQSAKRSRRNRVRG